MTRDSQADGHKECNGRHDTLEDAFGCPACNGPIRTGPLPYSIKDMLTPKPLDHVCGLYGYRPGEDPPCPGCERESGRPDSKATNPKDAIGSDKMPVHLWPMSATVMGTLGLLEGMLKYGRANWRQAGVRSSIYYDACRRHLDKWFEGEENAPDSGLPHLAHALACLAILVDAQAADMLNDDRQYNGGGAVDLLDEMTPHVKRLKEQYADRNPKHYTIQDDR